MYYTGKSLFNILNLYYISFLISSELDTFKNENKSKFLININI